MAKIFRLDIPQNDLVAEYEDGDENVELRQELTNYILAIPGGLTTFVNGVATPIVRGDIVVLDYASGYRNDGVFLWDGA